MPDINKIFSKVPIQIPNRSGFDMSHETLFTSKCGTLVPIMVDELLPNDKVTLGLSSQIQLPPMATDFYGRVRGRFEAFFVPNRLLYGGWQELITHPVNGDDYPSGTDSFQKAKYLPNFNLPISDCGAGSLADFLGVKIGNVGAQTTVQIDNILPFIAYGKIYEDWYRDSRIQRSLFNKATNFDQGSQVPSVANLPYHTYYGSSPTTIIPGYILYADGVKVSALRQRNWARDYFTNATPKPQAGDASALNFGVHIDSGDEDGTGTFTIAALRAANSLQQWLERNNIAGYRYADQIKAQYGIYPADAVTDRSLYLGSGSVDIYNKSVYQQQTDGLSSGRNPFDSTGSKYASSMGVGDMSLVDNFTASEHGFLVVMFSLVPDALYGSGIRRYLKRSSSADFAFPLLAGVGDQEIFSSELEGVSASVDSVFGYTQRYAEYKFMLDEVHGLLQNGQSLEHFALDRFISSASLGSSFLQIPINFLDDVTAVASAASNYGCWSDVYFKYKKASTLPAYSIPTLGDMKDTHTEVIDNGGKRL